ncbi:hypothetical protein QCA50_001676 [Cerrena zonata]|uniref:Mitochondrial import inner membrane translocase subunit n=1 Tax=Cerrena zonata TaxID=2478898 RepID=A0AAW0GTS2_9APHY
MPSITFTEQADQDCHRHPVYRLYSLLPSSEQHLRNMSDATSGLSFDESTRKELETFMDNERAQARVHSSIHQMTSMCWDKCVTGTPSTSFSRSESSCLANCVDRFLDTSLFLVNQVERQRQQFTQSS